MPALLPAAVLRSEKLYRRLLGLYPRNHRGEFGPWMAQVFRDQCRQAYAQAGLRGLLKVWLRTFPDLAASVVQEHEYEVRRWMVNHDSQNRASPRSAMGMLVSAVLMALGLLASVALREAGGPVMLALAVAVVCNLAGALVMDLSGRRDGAVLGAMALLMALGALPLLWVPDQEAWVRENPLTLGVVILLSGYVYQQYNVRWPLYAVAAILGAAHILISFI
jgi:hypothetical protein